MEPKYAVSKYNYSRLTELIRRKMRGRKFLRLSQGRSQLDNWGGGLILIHSCYAQLISFEIDCFYGVNTYI